MIKSLIDKICFTLGAIVFLQLPHFIEQYTQRMGGYASSQSEQIKEYQETADLHFAGDLEAYIERLQQNADPAVAASAQQISQRVEKTQDIQRELAVFEAEPLWYQVPYFITHMRLDLVNGTAKNFSPGLPINLWAWGYGLVGGVLFSLIFNGFMLIPKKISKKKQL
ncbi:DUF2937 family protein [Marinicella sp. S1101]|uniref:DUF2937 family protein n=1 Tax=Marinicella marina TaxID=2996016 RepID=UPI002260C642|nr:DUF2937 family protein [Marinicella marina]MCX7553698.1 DUF2937 family protein [Marinicella marina]MDJ1140788.1 DUF2937 family protein [Marinicella marina]